MAKMLTVSMTLKGTTALLMHNERLVNTFDPLVRQIKAINAKGSRKKTEDDALMVQRLEWEAGMYYAPKVGPYIPAANVKKMLMEAAVAFRGGMAVKRGVQPLEPEIPLLYHGPRDVEGLWKSEYPPFKDVRSVGVNKNKVLRCRPIFHEWGLETTLFVNNSVLDFESFQRFLSQAGKITGLGDYRPTYGRFMASSTVIEEHETEDATDMIDEHESERDNA